MSGDADKAWAEMIGKEPGAQRSSSPTPTPAAPAPSAPKLPTPPIASAAKWGAIAVLGLVAIIAVVWVILSNRTRPAIVDAPKQSTTTSADTAPTAPPTAPAATGSLLDLNSATAAQLEHLPGIGPAIAQRIIDDRTKHGRYTSVDDLDRVQGIGKKTIDKLRPYVMTK